VDVLYEIIDRVQEAGEITIPTPRLNRFLASFRTATDGGTGGPKLRYLTQVGVRPPSFLAFGPAAGRLHVSEVRHLENRLREEFRIGPTPIRIRFRAEKRRAAPSRRARPRRTRGART